MCMCHFGLHDRVKRAATLTGFASLSPQQATGLSRPRGSSPWEIPAHEKSPIVGLREYLVEMKGLEPSASGLQSPRSPS